MRVALSKGQWALTAYKNRRIQNDVVYRVDSPELDSHISTGIGCYKMVSGSMSYTVYLPRFHVVEVTITQALVNAINIHANISSRILILR